MGLNSIISKNKPTKRKSDSHVDNTETNGITFSSTNSSTDSTWSIFVPRSAKNDPALRQSRMVTLGRLIFFFCLLVLGILLGSLAYWICSESEHNLAEQQFSTINERAVKVAKGIAYRKLLGGDAMAKIVGQMLPNASAWPFVFVPGYNEIAGNIVPTSLSKGLNFAPILQPEEVDEWETFAYNHYDNFFPAWDDSLPAFNSSDPTNPNNNVLARDPATKPFGRGVWNKLPNGTFFHDVTGDTSPEWSSPNKIVVPKFHHSIYNSPLTMFNFHYPKVHGSTVDGVIECALNRSEMLGDFLADKKQELLNQNDYSDIPCGSISAMTLTNAAGKGPGGLMARPIYPAGSPTELKGFIVGFLYWNEVLEDIFADGVSGVDAVLTTKNQNKTYTYSITDGKPYYDDTRGEGDFHDEKYGHLGETVILVEPGNMNNNATDTYTLTLYPNSELFESYKSATPIYATVGAIVAMLLTSAMFIVYDYYVRREFTAKKELLEAKRQFVRFVSHEVRTPLNSVCMGLALLQEEIAVSLGYRSPESMMLAQEQEKAQNQTAKTAPGIFGKNKTLSRTEVEERDREWFELAHEVQTNAQSSVDVLNDLLNYDKIESGTLMLELTAVPIWDLVERTVSEFRLPAATKKIQLQLTLPRQKDQNAEEGAPPLAGTGDGVIPQELRDQKSVGDVVRLTQVLRNLVSNAIKFTPEGGKLYIEAEKKTNDAFDSSIEGKNTDEEAGSTTMAPPVQKTFEIKKHTVTYDQTGELVVKVRDTGAGMTKEQLSRLFRQGVQFNVNDLQAGNGSGLGLYIAKGIVEQHGGSLGCDSEGLGCGTTFTMTIPLYHVPDRLPTEVDQFEHTQRIVHTGDAEVFSKDNILRVLVVDDATSNRKLLGRLLKNRGHDHDEAENGKVGLEMVIAAESKGLPYDIVLLDYEMPVMNGPSAAKEIRSRGIDVFIVGITGNMMAEDVAFFRQCGANAVLPKPFKMASLEELCMEYQVTGREKSANNPDSSKNKRSPVVIFDTPQGLS